MSILSKLTLPPRWYRGPAFGLPIILVCTLGMVGQIGPIIYNAFGFFASALEDQYGWARGDMFVSLTIVSVAIFVAHPPAGLLIDRFGVKRVLLPSLALLGVLFLLTGGLVSRLWHLYTALAALAVLGIGANSMFYVRVISNWFDKRRGLVIGLVAAGSGLGVAVVPKAVQEIIDALGWRSGFYALGLVNLLVILPAMAVFLRDKPDDLGLGVDGGAAAADRDATLSGLPVAEAVKTKSFWLLLAAIGVSVFALYGVAPNMALILKDRGIGSDGAGLAALVLGSGMVVSRLSVGVLVDRIFAPHVGVGVFVLTTLGFALLTFAGSDLSLVLVAAALLGVGLGAEVDLIGFLVGRYFGLRHFGTIYGLVFLGFLAGTATGVLVVAQIAEAAGSYLGVLKALCGLSALTVLLFALMSPYDRYQARFRTA